MRQVLIAQTGNIADISFNRANLCATEQITLSTGMNKITIPFGLEVIQGGNIQFRFSIAKNLARNGVMLVGAYVEGDRVEAYLYSFEGEALINPGMPIIEIAAYETFQIRQVEAGVGSPVIVRPELDGYQPTKALNPNMPPRGSSGIGPKKPKKGKKT